MTRWGFLILVLALIAGCDRVAYIELSPSPVLLKQLNNEVRVHAKPMSRQGVHDPKADVSWTIKDPAIAKVDDLGVVRPLKSGRTELVVAHGKIVATAQVEVLLVEKIVVEPLELKLQEGGEAQEIKVKAFDFEGRELKDRRPQFRPADKKIVSLGQNAAFGLGAGETTVEVQVDAVKATVKVVVEADKKAAKK